MAGKTAKRVLVTALALFNEHGENSVTSVDIAMEMDISPGNLYYHFKGKELIVDALIEWHNTEMQQLFRPATLDKVTVEDFFYFLAIVIDKLQVFRFLYRSPADIAEKYPRAKRLHKTLIKQLEAGLYSLLQRFAAQQQLAATSAQQRMMVDLISMILTQSSQYDDLRAVNDPTSQKFHALSLIMTALLPRFALDEQTLSQLQSAIEHHSMANLTGNDVLEG